MKSTCSTLLGNIPGLIVCLFLGVGKGLILMVQLILTLSLEMTPGMAQNMGCWSLNLVQLHVK